MVGRFVIVSIVTLVATRTLSEDVPEFQYPCYVDVCTFPTQFCNSEKFERRCSPCSRYICRAPNVPLACRYICLKHNELSTTPKPTPTTAAQQQQRSASQGNDSLASLHLIMSYSAISTTLLVVVLLAFVAYYIHRKKESKEKRSMSLTNNPGVNSEQINMDHSQRPSQESSPCHHCGQRPRPETLNILSTHSPPSYTSQYNDQRLHAVPSQTETNDSSTESVNNTTKTQMVKPMTAQMMTKMNNVKKADNKISTRHKSVTDAAVDATALESLISNQETDHLHQTSLKSLNT